MRSFPPQVEDSIISTQDLFVWEAPAFLKFNRGPGWYFGMALIAVALMAYAVWTANFLFAFIILLMGILLLLVGNKEPNRVLVQVGDHGIVWNGKLILYQDLDEFAIVYHPPYVKTLYFDVKSALVPRLRIELEEQDPIALRNHLRQFLKEDLDLQSEHLSDIVARLLRL